MEEKRGMGFLLGLVTAAGVLFLCASTLLGWPERGGGGEPDVAYATGTAHCSGGTYDGIKTGNSAGSRRQTEGGSDGSTRGYTCDDGRGNSATVNCQANGGAGLCESAGSGSCGKFQSIR
jgi:hypothetical protein